MEALKTALIEEILPFTQEYSTEEQSLTHGVFHKT